jgi:hypothetical protein
MLNGLSEFCLPVKRRSGSLVLAAMLALIAAFAAVPATVLAAGDAVAAAHKPSPATVEQVESLFGQLGYPLKPHRPGVLDVSTSGAISYFQRKYKLPVTGYPDAATITLMKAVATSLRSTATTSDRAGPREAPPQDIVERILGANPPVLPVVVGLAGALALLALSVSSRPDYDSASAEDAITSDSRES